MDFTGLERDLRRLPGIEYGRGISDQEIDEAERILGVTFPADYRAYLRGFGWLGVGDLELYGLGSDAPTYLNLYSHHSQ